MKSIKIFEMFMRDGLQSLKPFPLSKKINMFNIINRNNFYGIEVGSSTNSKILPQMANSIELWNTIKPEFTNELLYPSGYKKPKHLTMLAPSKINPLITQDIRSFGLLTSVSEDFSKLNLNKSSFDSFIHLLHQMNEINILHNYHIRVYVSCVFGDIPDGKITLMSMNNLSTLIKILKIKIDELKLKPTELDIVLCDTIGNANCHDINNVLNYIDMDLMKYYALHLHSDTKFEPLINVGLSHGITKFDTSMLGIGGCPFAKKKMIGNISTYDLAKYLSDNNYKTNLDLELLKNTENKLRQII